MKLHTEKSKLEEGLLKVLKAISIKSPLPILTHILFKADKEKKLKLYATDLEIGIECKVDVEVLKKGSFCAPARVLTDIITKLPQTDVVLELKENKILEIRTQNSKYNINTLSEEDFPILPSFKELPVLELSKEKLKNIIESVIIACATSEETRTVLTGVLFSLKGQSLIMVSTDGRRLAKAEENLKEIFPKEEKTIIPSKALLELSRLLEKEEGNISIYLSSSQIFFKFNETILYSRIIEGQFPNYNNVIPTTYEHRIKIKREEFLSSLKRATILAQEKNSPNLIKMEVKGNKLIITSNTQDLGQAYEELEVENEGGAIQIAFNGKYIIDILSILKDEEVYLQLTTPINPGLIRPVTQDKYVYIVMPVKIKEEEKITAGA